MPSRKTRVLVINDTKEILELFRDILATGMGFEVTLMTFAPDELSRIVDERPDLVIVDFILGERELQGWQLLQKMRMHPDTASIPIVACTAAAREVRDAEAYLMEQGIEVVMKPFTIAQLEKAVRNALKLGEGDQPPSAGGGGGGENGNARLLTRNE
jgi:twitching motility two-component system response regulator PilH